MVLQTAALSANESRVLGALYTAESSLSSPAVKSEEPSYDPNPNSSLRQKENEILVAISKDEASRDAITKSKTELDELINQNPTHASAYVNRAQATRLLLQDEDLFHRDYSHLTTAILADLTEAIALATPRSTNELISQDGARILAAAHTHRAALLYKAATSAAPLLEAGVKLPSLDKGQLEELASRDFFWGGRYGNKVAQQMAVKTNPCAKMWSASVKEALKDEQHDVRKSSQIVDS